MTAGEQGDVRESISAPQIRAEWIRSVGFIVAFAGSSVMAVVDVTERTVWWLVGLGVTVIAIGALIAAAMRIPPARRSFVAFFRLRLGDARAAVADLNRVPLAPEPHRRPRQIARVFGPLSGLAALAAVVRLLII